MKIKQFTNSKWYKIILNVLGVVFIFFAWWIASSIINLSLFPTPIIAFKTMFSLLGKASSWLAIGETIKRLIVAFLISFAFALILGVLGGIFKGFRHFFNPVVIVLRTIPTAAVVIILVVLLKPTSGLYIIDFLLMFPILYEAVVSGVSSVDKSIIDALRLDDRKGSINSIGQIFIPMALPYIGLGIIQSLGLGMKVSIMAEVLCGSNSLVGIGRLMYFGYIESDMKEVFAVALIAIILIGIVDVLLGILKRKYTKNK
jgi:NitT/TauT family transport system permease protein